MTEQECLEKMVAPAGARPSKPYRGGVIQIHVTRACDKFCFNCTQGSNFGGKTSFMSPEQFEQAVKSLEGYWGVFGVFGGNPAISPHFKEYCEILRRLVPFNQRGIWSNNPITLDRAQEMARTFDPSISNLNVHLDRQAYNLFKQGWPAAHIVGLDGDSRHAPVFVAMKDVVKKKCERCEGTGNEFGALVADGVDPWQLDSGGSEECGTCCGTGQIPDESHIYEFISTCDINQTWSAMIGVFRGELRTWFCEIAGAQSMLHQDDPSYPDTGVKLDLGDGHVYDFWWKQPMQFFAQQVRKHCFDCGVPLRGHGELSQAADGKEQVSATHASIAKPKRKGRNVEVVTDLVQLDVGKLQMMTRYLQNANK